MVIKDDTLIEWASSLRDDILRINKAIKKIRKRVDKDINNLRLLETEREALIDKCTGGGK